MNETTSGRYRLMRSDVDAARSDGETRGDRDCLHAKRLGAEHYSSAPIDMGMREAESVAYRLGIDPTAVDLFPMVMAWMDGYRDGYEAEQYADEA